MKKIFAFVVAVLLLSGAYIVFEKSGLMREVFDGVPANVEAYSPDKFYYKPLSSNAKRAYDLIMKEIFDFPEKILIPELSDSELDAVYEAVLYDHPETFFLGENCSTKSGSSKTYFYPEYLMDKSQYDQQFEELEKAENDIVAQVTSSDEYEIELFLHDSLLKTCQYSDEVTNATSSPYACLCEKTASCEGYSKAMLRLLDKCGIECFLAVGDVTLSDGSSEGHMWDIVKINGNYYHLDPTWDDNNNDNSRLTYSYFNDSDDMIRKTHSLSDRYFGLCTSKDENFFVKTNAYFTSYNEDVKNKITALLVKNANKNSSLAPFMFENEKDYNSAKSDLFDNEQIYRLLERANNASDKSIITDRVYYWADKAFFVINIFNYYK